MGAILIFLGQLLNGKLVWAVVMSSPEDREPSHLPLSYLHFIPYLGPRYYAYIDFQAWRGSMSGKFWKLGYALGTIALLMSSCAELIETMPTPVLPPCVNDDCNCGDFRHQGLAQRVLETIPDDPYQLDRDGNGLACEDLPSTSEPIDPEISTSDSIHLTLGNPSHANTQDLNNYLIERQAYALAYNRDRGTPNWVSWQLDAAWLGDTERQDNFRPDGGLPKGTYQVTPNDYRNSGYDRGHMTPSGDRTRSVQDNAATFLMTNIIPQTPDNNRGAWRVLEEYARDLVYQDDRELFIIAGVYGERDSLNQRVVVPSRLWKVIVVLDQSGAGIDGVSRNSQVIVIDMPNRDGISGRWQDYQTSIDQIEVATGYDLLSAVPEDIQTVLEAKSANRLP